MTRTTPKQRSRIDRSIEIVRGLVVVLYGSHPNATTATAANRALASGSYALVDPAGLVG